MIKKNITQEEVEKVALLARINLNDDEKNKMAEKLSAVLEYFKSLSEVETSDVEPFDHYSLTKKHFRSDEQEDILDKEKEAIRELFPDRKDDYLKVKATLDKS